MLKTFFKSVGLLACLAWLNIVSAANMGGINVTSALGHPLKAEISLAELGPNDKSTLVAKMASVNDFKSAGIEYPYSMPKLTFEIDARTTGETFLRITSTQPVNEPFVSLLIELSWPSGKLLREYTFLLDPPGFVAEQPSTAEVKPVEPMLPAGEPVPAIVHAPEAASLPIAPADETAALPVAGEAKEAAAEAAPVLSEMTKAELAAAETVKAEPLSAEPVRFEPAEPVKVEPLALAPQAEEALIKVEKGATLGKIASEVKPVDVSLERMLVALYRANTKKFDGKNMNRIRAGKILRMPEPEEIEKVSQIAAVKEIRAQVVDWQNYRQKLAAAQSVSEEEAPKQEATGKISAAVAEKSPVIKESAKEVLKLSKGESLGDKTVAGAKGKQEKLADKADDAAAKSKHLQEEKDRIAKLENINKNVSKLVELKGGPVIANGAGALSASAPAAAVAAKPATVPAAQPAIEEPGIMDTIGEIVSGLLDDPMMLGGLVAVLLGLGGLGFVMARRGKTGQKKSRKKSELSSQAEASSRENEDIGSATSSWRTPVAPSPETGDFTHTGSHSPAAPMSVAAALDDVDPISEAELFLNFGRDAQAEEILKDALSKNPSSNQVKLKLLSIYANRKDSNSFSRYAQEVRDSGDEAAWERAAVMGREIDPDNPNYGGVKGEVRHREPPKAEVDFDLGFGKPVAPAASKAVPAKEFKMDFDVTGIQASMDEQPIDLNAPFGEPSGVFHAKSADVDATSILSRDDANAAQASSPMDFDVSGIMPGEAKKISNSTEMDFDISATLPAEGNATSQPLSMDFDLSGNIPSSVPEAAPAALNFDDMVFEIPTSQPKPVQEMPKAAADEGMEFTMDFQTSGTIAPPTHKPEPAKKLDFDFGDININFGEDVPPVHAGGEDKDEQWHEVATKLDLAKAYQEMGDLDGAREILEEVLRDGDDAQRESAEKLMQQIAA